MKPTPMSPGDIQQALMGLPGWTWHGDALLKTLQFASFKEALAFMVKAGEQADAMDHHPEWTNIYDKVAIRLTTHAVGNKVTANDVELAKRIEAVRAGRG